MLTVMTGMDKAQHVHNNYIMPLLNIHCTFTAILCEGDTCGENEICMDTAQGYVCPCENGYKKYQQNVCSKSSIIPTNCPQS